MVLVMLVICPVCFICGDFGNYGRTFVNVFLDFSDTVEVDVDGLRFGCGFEVEVMLLCLQIGGIYGNCIFCHVRRVVSEGV